MADDMAALLAGLGHAELVSIVKAAQKQQIQGSSGDWKQYIQAHCPQVKFDDPSRHTDKVLLEFLDSVVNADPAAAREAQAAAARGQKFVRRYLRWQRIQQAWPAAPAQAAAAAAPSTSGREQQQQPLPAHAAWSLAQRTRDHPQHAQLFTFPSYRKGWRCMRRPPPEALQQPPLLLALDCEMAQTDREENALLGVCVVDEQQRVIYNKLVRPRGTVLDYRTALTGVDAAQMAGVTLRRSGARREVAALLRQASRAAGGAAVVLVGHAVHHDLAALRLDYQPVLDTSLLHGYRGMPQVTPGLKHLAQQLLGRTIRQDTQQHDMREDASVAMALALAELRQQPRDIPLLPPPLVRVPKEDLCKLLVHALPAGTDLAQVAAIFAALGQPAQAVLGDPGSRKAHAVFKHAGEANEAFKRLPGRWELDSCGRRMKVAELPMGEGEAGADGDGDGGVKKPVRTVRVRLMAGHNGLAFWQPSKGKGHQPQDSAPAPAAEDGTPTAAAPAASLAAAATTTRGPAAVVGRKRQAERRAGNDAAGGKKRGKKG